MTADAARGGELSGCGAEPSPPAIELRHLRYFIAVFEELHFGHAAERLHISQPPLSQAIRRLEDELGVALLERTSRVVTPTAAGRVFAEEARAVLAGVDGAIAEARRAAGAEAAIRIGCVSDVPIQRLLRFLVALKRRQSTRVVTHLIPRGEVLRNLRRGELDLGIFPDVGDHDDIVTTVFWPGDPMGALLPPGHPLARRAAPLEPNDLEGEVLLTLPQASDPPLHKRFLASIEQAGYRFRTVQEIAGTDLRDLLVAVAQDGGVAFAPATLGEPGESVVAHGALEPAPVMPPTVVGWPASHRPWLEGVVHAARDVARELWNATDTEDAPEKRGTDDELDDFMADAAKSRPSSRSDAA